MNNRIVVVDDHALVRIGLRALLDHYGLDLVGEAASGRDGLTLIQTQQPDLALIDVRLPDMSGIQLCKSIRETNQQTRLAVLTSSLDKSVLHTAIQTGVQGYLLKDMAGEELYQAILNLLHGKSVLDPNVTAYALQWIESKAENENSKEVLNLRDVEVLRLMAQGQTNQEIGKQVHLSENTIKVIVNEIYRRLGVRSRVEAVMAAHQRGLL